MKKTMLTCDTLDRFEKFINPETLTAEQVQEVEHLAYCANMGAESKESAWIRFCELVKHFLNLDIIDTEKHPNISPYSTAIHAWRKSQDFWRLF